MFPAPAWSSLTPLGKNVEVSFCNFLRRLLSCSWLPEWGEAQSFLDCLATDSGYCPQAFSFQVAASSVHWLEKRRHFFSFGAFFFVLVGIFRLMASSAPTLGCKWITTKITQNSQWCHLLDPEISGLFSLHLSETLLVLNMKSRIFQCI